LADPLLAVKDLKTNFYTEEGVVQAVHGMSYDIQPGGIHGRGRSFIVDGASELASPQLRSVGVVLADKDVAAPRAGSLQGPAGVAGHVDAAGGGGHPAARVGAGARGGRIAARAIRRGQAAGRAAARRNAHVPSGRRCSDPARLVREDRVQAHRLRRVPGDGAAGGVRSGDAGIREEAR